MKPKNLKDENHWNIVRPQERHHEDLPMNTDAVEIFKCSGTGLVRLDKALKLTFANSEASSLFGKPQSELIGLSLWDVTPRIIHEKLIGEISHVLRDHIAAGFEMSFPASSDLRLYCICMPCREGYILAFRDTTGEGEKDSLESQQAGDDGDSPNLMELETLYRDAPIGLCVFDTDLHYVRINDYLAEINGLPADEHIGRALDEIVPGISEMAESVLSRIRKTGKPVFNVEIITSCNSHPELKRSFTESWLPIRDRLGNLAGIHVVVQEVTALRSASAALRISEELCRHCMKP